jgi:hypothetical protein
MNIASCVFLAHHPPMHLSLFFLCCCCHYFVHVITLITANCLTYAHTHRPLADSQKRYVENDVNIHYKVPVRYEFKHAIPDDELAHQQAEHMKKVYQEERRRKYLQELQDMSNRRHTDNFTPSQKSPIALNRYDDFACEPPSKSPVNLPGTVARALYSFQGQSARYVS